MNLRWLNSIALTAGLCLPVVITVLTGLGRLLAAMGDRAGAETVDRLILAGGVLWVVALVALVLVNAVRAELNRRQEGEEFNESPEQH